MIYFAQSPDGGPIKIGHSVNVPSRIKQLEAHYGQPLAVLATMPGGREEEREVHERFATARIGRTEQFRPVAEIMAFIGRPLLVCADPDAIEMMAGRSDEGLRIRMSSEFKAWMERYAAYERLTVATLIERTLVDAAKRVGFTESPPER